MLRLNYDNLFIYKLALDLCKLLQTLEDVVTGIINICAMATHLGIIQYYFVTLNLYLCYEVPYTDHNII